jgi:UDP-N-acetylmuramoyl-L-alanyl-D-glutamate--2,6-diaminopimelate ligase
LASFVKQGIKTVAMEVSSHGLSQGRVEEVSFYAAIFTNLSHDHLDYHGDMQSYALAKAKLFADLNLKYAILNADDPYSGIMKQALHPHIPCYYYSMGEHQLDVVVKSMVAHQQGFDLQLKTPWGALSLKLPLLGRFNVYNTLATLSCVGALGYKLEHIAQALDKLEGARGRMEQLTQVGKPKVIIDYAHTPDALEKALLAVREHCPGKLWVVFGCGGNRDRTKRPMMGAIAERLADKVIITEDNRRFEDIEHIIADILGGLKTVQTVKILPDRREAIHFALVQAGANDCILLAGKGHETYLEVKGLRQHFDEREVVKEVWSGEFQDQSK